MALPHKACRTACPPHIHCYQPPTNTLSKATTWPPHLPSTPRLPLQVRGYRWECQQVPRSKHAQCLKFGTFLEPNEPVQQGDRNYGSFGGIRPNAYGHCFNGGRALGEVLHVQQKVTLGGSAEHIQGTPGGVHHQGRRDHLTRLAAARTHRPQCDPASAD